VQNIVENAELEWEGKLPIERRGEKLGNRRVLNAVKGE